MSVVKRPVVVDGEGIDPTDFNRLSQWSRAYLNDIVIGAWLRTRSNQIGPDDDSNVWTRGNIYAIGHSGAPRNQISALMIGCNPGTIFYVPTGVGATPPDGMTPNVRAYRLQQNEIAYTLAVGDATHPRFDAVYVKVDEIDSVAESRNWQDAGGTLYATESLITGRETRLQTLKVQGTPSATPQVPAAPDSSWAPWGVWYVPKAWNAPLAYMTRGGSNVFDYRIPCDRFARHVRDVHTMYPASSGTPTVTLNGYDGFAGFTDTTIHAWVAASCPVNAGRIMGFSWTPLAHDAGSVQRLLVRTGTTVSGGSAPAAAPWANSIYGGLLPGDPTIAANDIDGYSLIGGTWYNAAGTVVTTTASGLALLPLWANGYGSTAEDVGQNGGQGLAHAGSAGDYSQIQALWIPNAITDKLVACGFDVAG
jgi:hypothetical protein